MSSLLSAYLDIWPDIHCKEGQSDDIKDGKKASERTQRRNGTDISETTTGGNQLFGRENKEQTKSEKNHEERDGSCRAPQDGKIQCGRCFHLLLFLDQSQLKSAQMQSPAVRA